MPTTVINSILVAYRAVVSLFMLLLAVGSAYIGVRVLMRGHLYVPRVLNTSHLWFIHSLYGLPAVIAGFAYLSFGIMFFVAATGNPWIASRIPAWARISPWWFFGLWVVLYFTAYYMPQT